MSEGQVLWLLVALFYVSECCYWVPRGALVWRYGRGWIAAGGEIGNDTGRLVIWNPLSEAGRGAVFEPWPFSVSATGVSGVRAELPNPGGEVGATGVTKAWEAIERIGSHGDRVVVDGRVLARCASAAAARAHRRLLVAVKGADAEAREGVIREALERALDAEAIGERWEAFSRDGRWAILWCSVVGWAMLAWVPVVYWLYGDGVVVLAAAGMMWMAMVTAAVLCFRLQRRWFPEDRGGRWQQLLVSVFAPPHAARGADGVSRDVMVGFHPMGVVADDGGKRKFAAAMRDLWFPVVERDDAVVREFREAVLKPVFEAAGRSRGLELEDVLAEPAEREAGSGWYCPRCHAGYVEAVGSCADCEGVELKRFS